MNITFTKKIAKQGKNQILIIPKVITAYFNSGDLVKVQIEKLEEPKK